LRNEDCARRTFHVTPSVSMYADALAQILVDQRKLTRWGVVADGSPRGAEIEAAVRRSVARRGGAVIGDTAAADVVLLALGPRAAAAAMSRGMAEGRRAARISGPGEAGLRLPPERAAGLWAIGWHHDLERFSARELNARFRRRWNAPMTETAWAAWAAVKLIGEAVVRGGAADGDALVAFLEAAPPFDGHKGGPLTFRKWGHPVRQAPYVAGARGGGGR